MTLPPVSRKKTPLLPTVVFFTVLYCNVQAVEIPGIPALSLSGCNELRFAGGDDIDEDPPQPWKYFVNSTDLRVGAYGFYLQTRFDVEEPSLGYYNHEYNPKNQVYREYFSRRTIGFERNSFSIEAGHLSAQFGRGLTLSMKEDREIEEYALLDGVYGQLRFPWVTLQAVVGRPFAKIREPVTLSDVDVGRESYTDFVMNEADMHMRDIVAGGYAEVFFPVEKAFFSFLTSGSIGGGLMRYDEKVGPFILTYNDTVHLEKPFWYQNRTSFYLPSASLNVTRDDFGLSIENSWITGRLHQYFNTMDSATGAFDSAFTTPTGSSTYLAANALLFGVFLLAEYKNYFYHRSLRVEFDNPEDKILLRNAYNEVATFFIPPSTRYQHLWHLLNKQLLSNTMGDNLGYNLLITAFPTESATITGNFSYGGRHNGDRYFQIEPNSGYWEAYAEWYQEAGERLNFRVGFDYGKLDPDHQTVTYRTLACDIETGPFGKGHAFGCILESQLNDKLYLAEKDSGALENLIIREVPPDSLVEQDIFLYDDLVPDDKRTRYRQYAFNLLATLSYHFSPWLSLSLTFEHEVLFDGQENIHVVTAIGPMSINNYASIGLSLKPTPRHTIRLEYGSMSGGKICTTGECVNIPKFKGFKLLVSSTL